MKPHTVLIFPSQLGWMALITAGATVKQLSFGHATADAAKAAVSKDWADSCTVTRLARRSRGVKGRLSPQLEALIGRLQTYASGAPDDFRDIPIDPGPLSEFQQSVVAQCQRVAYGSTISYADLAAKAGSRGAARAVGNCMAANRIPLIIPCHRVVCSDGRLGSYSAPGGTRTKRRLLALESHN